MFEVQEEYKQPLWVSDPMEQILEFTKMLNNIKNKHFFIVEDSIFKYERAVSVEKLLKEGITLRAGAEYHISINTFGYKARGDIKRQAAYCTSRDFCFIDVDFDDPLKAIDFIQNNLYSLPLEPNLVFFSGRGIWLFYRVENTSKAIWDKLQHGLVKSFDAGDAKATDISRYMRLVGSTNAKSNQKVSMIKFTDEVYTIDRIARAYNVDITTKPKVTKPKSKITSISSKQSEHMNLFSLSYNRVLDLKKLIELRGYGCKGFRNNILHLVAVNICKNSGYDISLDKLLEDVQEINSMFMDMLPYADVLTMCKTALSKKYKYSNKTIIDKLCITLEEQRELNTIISKEIKQERNSKAHKLKRRDAGVKSKEEYNKQRKIEAQKKLEEDLAKIRNVINNGVCDLSENKKMVDLTGLSLIRIKRIKKLV